MQNILTLIAIVGISFLASAQDPTFTQKTGNINRFNPALVGAQSDFGLQANYNNQWPSLPNNPQNYSILTNYNLKKGFGLGLDLGDDLSGLIQKTYVKVNTNYRRIFGDVETSFGVNLGFRQNKINTNGLLFEDQIDPSAGFINPTSEPLESDPKYYFILDLGGAAYYKGFLFGLAAHQVNRPNTSIFQNTYTRLPARFVANLGYMPLFKGDFQLAAVTTFQQQHAFTTLENQVFTQYTFMKLGLGHRIHFGEYGNTDFFSASAGIQFNKFSVGYSYENTPFKDSRVSWGGTHQATAAWYIKGLNRENGMIRLINVML